MGVMRIMKMWKRSRSRCDDRRAAAEYYVYSSRSKLAHGEPYDDFAAAIERICSDIQVGLHVTVFVAMDKRAYSGDAFKRRFLH